MEGWELRKMYKSMFNVNRVRSEFEVCNADKTVLEEKLVKRYFLDDNMKQILVYKDGIQWKNRREEADYCYLSGKK